MKDEILDADELDEVAGGYLKELAEDVVLIKKLGIYNFDSNVDVITNLQNGFAKFGNDYGMKITVKVHNGANKYFVNDKEMSRDRLVKMIDTLAGK